MLSRTKLTSKGQVTVPYQVRKALNMEEGDYLVFEPVSEYEANVRVVKSRSLSSLQGALQSDLKDRDFAELREQARDSLADRKSKSGED